jgi:phosphatidylserine/phosphatidylglycerophosphate/cardiolipin synthase-like enzyme
VFGVRLETKMKKIVSAILLLIWFLTLLQLSEAGAEVEVFFSPEGEMKGSILAEIESSRETIDVAIHEITSLDIAQALSKAKQRGVKVRVITDSKQSKVKSSRITSLVTQGVQVKILKGKEKGVMNHRFAIFDGKKVLTGSFNWSEGSENLNYENMVIFNDKEAVGPFQNEFDRLWREKRVIK